jgi:hypothetical protein
VVVAIFNFPYVTILDLCSVVVAIFNFPIIKKITHVVKDHQRHLLA